MKELLYYTAEILQETWWIALLMGVITVLFMHFAPKYEEYDSLDSFYNTGSSAESEEENKDMINYGLSYGKMMEQLKDNKENND